MRANEYYSLYYVNLATLLILGIIPLSLLVFFNYMIYQQIKSPPPLLEDQARARRLNQERDLARILIAIVTTFILCHLLRLFLNIHETVIIKEVEACFSAKQNGIPPWVLIVDSVSSLMVVINSSVNMVIYCAYKPTVRRQITSYKTQMVDYITSFRTTQFNV